MLPLIVGIGFEFLMIAGKHSSNIIVKILSAPGLWLQRITTCEPDDSQLEVAITALRHAIPAEFEESLLGKEEEPAADAPEAEEE